VKTLVSLIALALSAPALAAPADDLKKVIDDHWAWYLRNNPEQASGLGHHEYDALVSDPSLANQDRQARDEQGFLDRLNAIPDAGLDSQDRVNKAILSRVLREDVAGTKFGERQILFTSYYSWWQGFASLPEGLRFSTREDYDNYLTRLTKFPAQNVEYLKISRQAVTQGFTQPCVTLDGMAGTITGVIQADPAKSRFYEPFTRPKPATISDGDWAALKTRAAGIITGTINPEYTKIADWYGKEYKCRATVGASDMPQGRDYYALQVARHTTTTLTPDQIHQTGLDEVKRIGAEMDALARKNGFADRKAMVAQMTADPAQHAKTADELLAAAAWQNKKIDGLLPRYFGKLPRLTYGVKAIPAETAEGTTTAYSQPGSLATGVAGNYWVNTSRLDQRPLYELPALTAHEASPGHQTQLSLQQELDLPNFRKYAVGFTAYVEGWALYTEHLGIEMGLYDTPQKDMARLSYEMWRACRLVVDTGVHAKGWTKPQAIAFMREQTGLSDKNIEAEVNRYISWPGQALGYKMGELKIRELRSRAETSLGPAFDLRAFHDAVLALGPVPLDVLDSEMSRWMIEQKADAAK
jgi:uncharacterized protein (DUF885 family)